MEIRSVNQKTLVLKGKKESVVINPDKGKIESRMVVFLNPEDDFIGLEGDKVVIKGPGEYEIGGIEIIGINGGNNQTVYTFRIDGVLVGVLPKLKEELSEKRVEKIAEVDVLVSVVNGEGVGEKKTKEWAKHWGAYYLVLTDYSADTLKKQLDGLDQEGLEPVDVLKVEKESLPDGMEVVVLKNN